ncbi:MAG: PadR family transcriptional regulator [Methanosphaera sp.]|uniref:PadR family transcriptional regulator n=1 Tax=Methanosphaera sp. TaxID=2666342 RepID=UPI002E76743D|nr:PadR family transcriptional regulator [Methanosphaera sp.]MEE1117765.1 PadR family transcriptional regulator [Methanosphaera sp.]MEE3323711.1 PadR family transcriptional regulator [Methanosphaera sp.]MEE3418351.1 PadR family transcriptional regulator [Methanosphaera sp.]
MVEEDFQNDIDYQFLETKFLHSLMKGVRNIFLLWLISQEKIHGYAIISKINEIYSNMGVKVVHGSTIYPILHSLEKEGLIVSSEEYNGNHKVKMYEITERGIITLNSIKKFIKQRPSNDTLITYFDDMLFNDREFIFKEGVR